MYGYIVCAQKPCFLTLGEVYIVEMLSWSLYVCMCYMHNYLMCMCLIYYEYIIVRKLFVSVSHQTAGYMYLK